MKVCFYCQKEIAPHSTIHYTKDIPFHELCVDMILLKCIIEKCKEALNHFERLND